MPERTCDRGMIGSPAAAEDAGSSSAATVRAITRARMERAMYSRSVYLPGTFDGHMTVEAGRSPGGAARRDQLGADALFQRKNERRTGEPGLEPGPHGSKGRRAAITPLPKGGSREPILRCDGACSHRCHPRRRGGDADALLRSQ